jgi:hypothetical protein
MTPPDANARQDATRAASTVFGGFGFLAAFNAVAIAVAVPSPGFWLRVEDHLYDASETLGMGAVLALAAFVLVRYVPLSRRALGALALAGCVALAYRVLGSYLTIVAQHVWDGRLATLAFVVMIVALGVAIAGAPILALEALERPIARALPIPFAVAVLIVDHIAWRDDYADAHGMLALGTLLFAGTVLAPHVERRGRALAKNARGRAVLAGLGLFAIFGLVHPPPVPVRFELFRQPAAIAPWTLATLVWPLPEPHAPVQIPDSPWLHDRSNAPAILPTSPRLLPEDAVIVLVTLDAIRADVAANPNYDVRFPTLARLKREGVVFTHASTPGAQTEVSMAALFSGRYASELPWKDAGSGWDFHPHPATDHFVRFPELLSEHGVTTVNESGIPFLTEGFGVVRGFREETRMLHKKSAESAFNLIHAMDDRLGRGNAGPLFICTHLTESHSPYGSGRPGDPDYQRYLTSIAYLDGRVGQVLKALQKGYGQRWALVVSSDHGEAFGQHQTTEHGKTLYEDLLHVPLIAMSPLFPAHTVDAPVGLIDLGPTFLDLFGIDTPATFNGQSLVPFLAGHTTPLTRPLIAEGRLRTSLTEPDGLKVIDDPRRKVVEVYDLAQDPGETRNLFDLEPARSDAALAKLRAFFAVHAWREPGYEAPYKP